MQPAHINVTESLTKDLIFLRESMEALFSLTRRGKLFLTPGVTVALRLLMPSLGIQSIAMSDQEYYVSGHFPAQKVSIIPIEHLSSGGCVGGYDALILSDVSWTGRRLPLEIIFGFLKRELGTACPILIADCSHSGAAGFAASGSYFADIVLGDLSKWMLPTGMRPLAFIYSNSSRFDLACEEVFASLFLSTENSVEHAVRWIEPDSITSIAGWMRCVPPCKVYAAQQYERNVMFKHQLLDRLRCDDSGTLMLWTGPDEQKLKDISPSLLSRSLGLCRIMCREDVQKEHQDGAL